MRTPWDKDKETEKYSKLAIMDAVDILKANTSSYEGAKIYSNKLAGISPHKFVFDELGHANFSNNYMNMELQYEIKRYPDGTQYVVVLGGDQLTFKIDSYNDLWTLNQINDVLINENRTCTLTIPNMLEAQADRRFNGHESSGLKLVCQFLNSLKTFDKIKVFHPHNSEVVEALIDRVEIVDNSKFISEVMEIITDEGDFTSLEDFNDNFVVLLPDGGAYKWGVKLADKIHFKGTVLAGAKNRQFVEGHSKLTQQLPDYDFTGKSVIIIDDISIGGGTFKGLSKLLKEKNCGELFLAVSHMTIQDLGEDPVTNYFDKVYTTNSKFNNYYDGKENGLDQPKNLEVIKLF